MKLDYNASFPLISAIGAFTYTGIWVFVRFVGIIADDRGAIRFLGFLGAFLRAFLRAFLTCDVHGGCTVPVHHIYFNNIYILYSLRYRCTGVPYRTVPVYIHAQSITRNTVGETGSNGFFHGGTRVPIQRTIPKNQKSFCRPSE